jgi:hypothetical protein
MFVEDNTNTNTNNNNNNNSNSKHIILLWEKNQENVNYYLRFYYCKTTANILSLEI